MVKRSKENENGFTLVELLIVVAIIAVLVAVSIPIFTSQLEKSREATDLANFRAAKAAFIAKYIIDETLPSGQLSYNATDGIIDDSNPYSGPLYGKGTSQPGNEDAVYDTYDPTVNYENGYVVGEYANDKDGNTTLSIWWKKVEGKKEKSIGDKLVIILDDYS